MHRCEINVFYQIIAIMRNYVVLKTKYYNLFWFKIKTNNNNNNNKKKRKTKGGFHFTRFSPPSRPTSFLLHSTSPLTRKPQTPETWNPRPLCNPKNPNPNPIRKRQRDGALKDGQRWDNSMPRSTLKTQKPLAYRVGCSIVEKEGGEWTGDLTTTWRPTPDASPKLLTQAGHDTPDSNLLLLLHARVEEKRRRSSRWWSGKLASHRQYSNTGPANSNCRLRQQRRGVETRAATWPEPETLTLTRLSEPRLPSLWVL